MSSAIMGAFNMTTKSFNAELEARGWLDVACRFPVYCDPVGGERIQEISGSVKANNSVESGIDFINTKIERRQFYVCETCTGVLCRAGVSAPRIPSACLQWTRSGEPMSYNPG